MKKIIKILFLLVLVPHLKLKAEATEGESEMANAEMKDMTNTAEKKASSWLSKVGSFEIISIEHF